MRHRISQERAMENMERGKQKQSKSFLIERRHLLNKKSLTDLQKKSVNDND